MAVDLSPIDESLLATIANIHGMPKGAFNIRRDGKLVERHSSAYIEIETKTDNPGIDIKVKPGTKGETVFIPVIVTQSGLKDVVYNTFYIGDDCDVEIIAGCGIHNDSHAASEHDGIHSFHIGKNSRIKYIEKHYGEGEGTGERILNPTTNVYMDENSYCEMEMLQLRGVTSTVRDTNAKLGAGAKLVLTERLLTHDDQTATSNVLIELEGEDSSVQIISRSVAQDRSVQIFNPLVVGAYTLFVASTLLTVYAYKEVPLSLGPVLEATSYVYVTAFGVLIFHERITPKKLAALALIIGGICVFALLG